jgi:class 3 adenylate cyclase/tetratricopeptide (TPR) repeat protein
MECQKCQFENRPGAKFCLKCGTELELQCPRCGKRLPSAAVFCDECGFRLTAAPEPAPIDYSRPRSYTPKFLADKILTTRSSIEGERKLVTVLFADVAGYTSMAEKLDPEEVHQIMDGCFKILMTEIHKYEGTINQFTGDGVMALFGAPVAHEDHAQRACKAALGIQAALRAYGEKVKKECGADFKMRIGLNSGPVVVGAIGDDLRMDYTAVGDTTNLALRMQTAAGPDHTLVSENTHRLVKTYFEFEPLGPLAVKGKEKAHPAYTLIRPSEVATRLEASISRGLVRFVGRKNSMAAMNTAWEKVLAGLGQVLGIVGEVGVGKSRLLLEFRKSLSPDGFAYLEGRCLHYGGTTAYLPFLDILKSCCGIEEGQREYVVNKNLKETLAALDRGLLAAALPACQDLLSLKVEDESWQQMPPRERRELTFDALRNIFIRLSQEKPLILAVEDLHWIDKTSEEFLNYLIDWIAQSPILLVLLHRPEYTHRWGSKSYFGKIGLNQLTTESSTDLVAAILEGGKVAPELKQFILNRAAGNPLFIEEFTHSLLENGTIQKRSNRFILGRKADQIQVPDTIQGMIAARLDRLEDTLKRIMQVASVIGRRFAFCILQTVTGMSEELKACLLNLQGLEFIYEKRLFPELEYIFKHALTQEVAYGSLLGRRRKEIHAKIGEAVEQIYSGRLDEYYEMLSYHFLKSENYEKAYTYFKRSAQKADRRYAHWEAYYNYTSAIDVLTKLSKTEEVKRRYIEICQLMHSCISFLNYPDGSLKILHEGVTLAKELGDQKGLSNLVNLIRWHYQLRGGSPKYMKYSETHFCEALERGDIDLLVPTGWDLCQSYFMLQQYQKIVDSAPRIIETIERTDRKTDYFGRSYCPYPWLCGLYGLSLGHTGDFESGKIFCEKALETARRLDDWFILTLVHSCYGSFYVTQTNGVLAIEHYMHTLRCTEKTNDLIFRSASHSTMALGYYYLNDLDSALKSVNEGRRIAEDLGVEFRLSYGYFAESLISFAQNDMAKASNAAHTALRLACKNKEPMYEALAWFSLGRITGKAGPGQFAAAQNSISKGMEICKELNFRPRVATGHFYLAELHADDGQKEEALRHLHIAGDMFREMDMPYFIDKTKELLAAV